MNFTRQISALIFFVLTSTNPTSVEVGNHFRPTARSTTTELGSLHTLSVAGLTLPSLAPSLSPSLSAAAFPSAVRKGFQLGTGLEIPILRSNVEYLVSLGARILRFQMLISEQQSLDYWVARIDSIVPICESHQVVLVLDFHAAINDEEFFVQTWRALANRYRNKRQLWYDLANEPSRQDWRRIALRAARAIRRIDGRAKIVFAPRGASTAPSRNTVPLQGIANQVLEFHFWDWYRADESPSIQGQARMPYPSPGHTKEDLRRLLQSVKDCGTRNRVPVYIGEVGIYWDHPNAARFLRDFTSLCSELEIPLTLHAFREADVWNYEQSPIVWQVIKDWLGN